MATFKATHRLQLKQLERRDPATASMAQAMLDEGLTVMALKAIASGLKRCLKKRNLPPMFSDTRGAITLTRPAPRNIGDEIKQLLGQPTGTLNPKPRRWTAEERERAYAFALGSQQKGFSIPWTDSARLNKFGRRG